MNKIKELFNKYREIIMYLVFGVLTTLVGWAVYFVLLWVWKAAFSIPSDDTTGGMYIAGYTLAQVVQWIAAVLFAFFTNRAWVFTDAEKNVSLPLQLGRFAAGRVATFGVDYVVTFFGGWALSAFLPMITAAPLLGKEFNLAEIGAKIVAAVIVIVCNYIFSKIFVFQKKGEESFWKNKRKRSLFIVIVSVVIVLSLLLGACAIYLGDYYRADEEAIEAFAPMSKVKFRELSDGSFVFEPDEIEAGFIFYPGGKVENDAYKPLMAALESKGIFCVLVEMPFNLAVFDINAADGIIERYPQVEDWYIGGHSLGGAMAATYLGNHTDDFEGLVLLGAYSTVDLSKTDLTVLSIFGSEDKVMDREAYSDNRSNLPSDAIEAEINGGCHAYFGMYGHQSGDGEPSVTNEKQINITANAIFEIILRRGK